MGASKIPALKNTVTLTQAQYEALDTGGNIDPNTVYIITDDEAPSDTTYSKSQVDAKLGDVESAIAIVATGNTHAAISSGQYVYVKGHSTLGEGMYKATTNIAANATLSTSNLSAVSNGAANDLKSAFDNVTDGMTFKRIHVDMVGKTVGTTYTVDLPSGYTFANTIFISASYRVWNSVYDAFGNDANVECGLSINSSSKISIKPIGQYSVNGELVIVIAKE